MTPGWRVMAHAVTTSFASSGPKFGMHASELYKKNCRLRGIEPRFATKLRTAPDIAARAAPS